jgi:RNA-directed DNA polymerase
MPRNPGKVGPRVEVGKTRLSITSVRHLEFILGISRTTLESVASRADTYYDPFPKSPKTRPFQKIFKPTKERLIDNPVDPLRTIQKRIQRRLLASLDLPFYLCGGVKDRSLMDNVTIHLGASVLVAVDIKNFFPSIHNRIVYRVWSELLGCSPEISSLLTRLTTREHHLPQGSSTSTTLANLALFMIDGPIRAACDARSVHYSTWVDDLAFSGANARDVLPTVIQTLKDSGLAVSPSKLRIMGPGTRKVLNGVLLGHFPSVLPERVSQLNAGIHNLKIGLVPEQARRNYIQRLGSSIAQVASISPRRAAPLQADLDAVVRELRIRTNLT